MKAGLGVIGLAGLALLAACQGPTGYREAGFLSDYYGYTDRELSTGEIAVTVRTRPGTPPQRAAEIALLHAAKLTLARGATHFRVVQEQGFLREAVETGVVPIVVPGFYIPVPVGSTPRSEPMAVLLIRLWPAGVAPDDTARDAGSIVAELEPRLR